MSGPSKIEWTQRTWNPVRGCAHVSEGCRNCYAEAVAARFSGPGLAYEGLAERRDGTPRWTGKPTFGHDLEAPLRWRRPSVIFVNSMSDLFHEAFSREEIATIFVICVAAHHLRGHTSQILTKRSARLRALLNDAAFWDQVNAEAAAIVMDRTAPQDRRADDARASLDAYGPAAPPPGIWVGVSCEDQKAADSRIPDLLATPAAVRFVSAEPLLGPIDFRSSRGGTLWIGGQRGCAGTHRHAGGPAPHDHGPSTAATAGDPRLAHHHHDDRCRHGLDWVIVGGESGPRARPVDPDWCRPIRDQCAAAGTAFFFKQWGDWVPAVEGDDGMLVADGGDEHRLGHVRAGAVDRAFRTAMWRVGKRRAGRLLDGMIHDDLPEARR